MVFHRTPLSAMSVAASQPVPKSNGEYNLTHRPVAPLCAVKMIYLSSLSDFNPHPSRGMFTYLMMDFYFLLFGEATEHLYTDRQYPNKVSHSFSWSVCTNRRHQNTQVPTNTVMQTHLCCLRCFDRPVGVWGPLETSWPWERCLPIRWQLCAVTMALICNLLFCLSTFSGPDKDHCGIDRYISPAISECCIRNNKIHCWKNVSLPPFFLQVRNSVGITQFCARGFLTTATGKFTYFQMVVCRWFRMPD